MSFLRQLFRMTTRRDPTIQKLARPNHKTLVTVMDYEKEGEELYKGKRLNASALASSSSSSASSCFSALMSLVLLLTMQCKYENQ